VGEPGGRGIGNWGKQGMEQIGSGANWRLRASCHSSGVGEPHNRIEWGMTWSGNGKCENRLAEETGGKGQPGRNKRKIENNLFGVSLCWQTYISNISIQFLIINY
jgi:hypothetical protein